MIVRTEAPEEKVALSLSARDWLVAALMVTALLAVAPHIRLRDRVPAVEKDYRIPYAQSSRYEIYRRFTELSAAQYPTIIVGDSVIWGQCARREETLSHHLNDLTQQPRFANAGLDGMHPVALVELIEHHAPAITHKDVILQFDPLWFMALPAEPPPKTIGAALINRPGLVPRLAADWSGGFRDALNARALGLLRSSPLVEWSERLADSRLDFLAWSLDHPYEAPLRAITSGLPASEDGRHLRLAPWNGGPVALLESDWSSLDGSLQWRAFERLINLLEQRDNRVLVVVGPMNEHMMSPGTRERYGAFKEVVRAKLRERGVAHFMSPLLARDHYGDVCHPLAAGYRELARALLRTEPGWILHSPSDR